MDICDNAAQLRRIVSSDLTIVVNFDEWYNHTISSILLMLVIQGLINYMIFYVNKQPIIPVP